jgi:hypothetical protein
MPDKEERAKSTRGSDATKGRNGVDRRTTPRMQCSDPALGMVNEWLRQAR